MTWGFQLMIKLAPARYFSGESGVSWNLPLPVGSVSIIGTTEIAGPQRSSELTFRASGFESHGEANEAAETLRDWLRLVSVFQGDAFDIGKDDSQSGLGDDARDKLEKELLDNDQFLVPDVHGIVCFPETSGTPVRFAMRGTADLFRTSESLVQNLGEFSDTEPLTIEQRLACELVALALRQTSIRIKMITLVTAMELLIESRSPSREVRTLLEDFKRKVNEEMERSPSDDLGLRFLLRSLDKLGEESISESLRELARSTRPNDAEDAALLVDEIYGCRSDLVHGNVPSSGGYSEGDAEKLWPSAFELAKDMIRKSVGN